MAIAVDDFEIGDNVHVDALGMIGRVAEIDGGRVALKFAESDCIFWSPRELLRKAEWPSVSSSNSVQEVSECSMREVRSSEYETEQAPALVPELERTSIAFDKDILKWQNQTKEINKKVIDEENDLTDMEKIISANESGIELLTQQSIILAAHLRKIEPAFESIGKVKSFIEQIKSENTDLQSSLVDAGERIEKLKSSKQQFELQNSELQKKAAFTTEKWKTRLNQRRYDIDEGLNQVCESISILNIDTARLTKDFNHEIKKQEEDIKNLAVVKDCIREHLQEKEEIKEKVKILREGTSSKIENITFLEKAIAMLARSKAFKFVPTVNTIEEFLSQLENSGADTVVTEKNQDAQTLGRMISALCDQNSALKQELSQATSKLLKVMVESSTSNDL